jgi:hypothetical protein
MTYQPTPEQLKGAEQEIKQRLEHCQRLEKEWELKKLEQKKAKKK